jgi:hypothetical protein
MRHLFLSVSIVVASSGLVRQPIRGQQIADSGFVPSVAVSAFAPGTGPVIAVDAGHRNFHTLSGRYAPFGAILQADGYRVREITQPLAGSTLAPVHVLVIANAGTDADASWKLPTPSAFTEAEIATVREWVELGGSLLLLVDHMPAAGATQALGEAFGLHLTNGYTVQPRPAGQPGDLFLRDDGSLYAHPITLGRSETERVDTIVTFTGQGFQVTTDVDTLLQFGPAAVTLLPAEAGVGFTDQTPRVYSGGWLHGVAFRLGRGRVVVFGEAAMFSAQVAGPARLPMGLNHPLASQNQQLLLNTVHWLTGVLEQ